MLNVFGSFDNKWDRIDFFFVSIVVCSLHDKLLGSNYCEKVGVSREKLVSPWSI